MVRRKYTDEQKAEALALYKEYGPGEASRRLHIPIPTIASWARRAGVNTDAPAATREAVEMAKLSREQKRELLREKLLDQALTMVDGMDAEVTIVTKQGSTVKIPVDVLKESVMVERGRVDKLLDELLSRSAE